MKQIRSLLNNVLTYSSGKSAPHLHAEKRQEPSFGVLHQSYFPLRYKYAVRMASSWVLAREKSLAGPLRASVLEEKGLGHLSPDILGIAHCLNHLIHLLLLFLPGCPSGFMAGGRLVGIWLPSPQLQLLCVQII